MQESRFPQPATQFPAFFCVFWFKDGLERWERIDLNELSDPNDPNELNDPYLRNSALQTLKGISLERPQRTMTHTDDPKSKMLPMIRTLRKMFLNSPDKSQITLKGKCQTCNKEMAVDIVPTSGGFGVLGGVLTELTSESSYRLLCPKCHTQVRQNKI